MKRVLIRVLWFHGFYLGFYFLLGMVHGMTPAFVNESKEAQKQQIHEDVIKTHIPVLLLSLGVTYYGASKQLLPGTKVK